MKKVLLISSLLLSVSAFAGVRTTYSIFPEEYLKNSPKENLSLGATPNDFFSHESSSECPSAEGHLMGYKYTIEPTGSKKASFQAISVSGDQKRTWVRFSAGGQWPVPYVQTTDGKDLFLSWDDDGSCMMVFVGGGQSFYLGMGGEAVHVKWQG